jgi:hypothetical protein
MDMDDGTRALAADQDENMVDKVGQTLVDNVDSVLKVLVNNL